MRARERAVGAERPPALCKALANMEGDKTDKAKTQLHGFFNISQMMTGDLNEMTAR